MVRQQKAAADRRGLTMDQYYSMKAEKKRHREDRKMEAGKARATANRKAAALLRKSAKGVREVKEEMEEEAGGLASLGGVDFGAPI